ncbi:hypothetical protein OH76DRAFT_1367339 [Lentinus brumalis]|uniref:DPH-type MB domain-containing protein n=1 Tax=Lentinus brumalis TaxID=2498619 RepID=A0A371CH44_9APHY|nr:hypothetical protein OH76DRAFT_1367339 [Polyporus brumalis]
MGAYYDEVEIEDMVWDEEQRVHHYPCPCGDGFDDVRRCSGACVLLFAAPLSRSLALSSVLCTSSRCPSLGRRRIPPALTCTAGSVCCTKPCGLLAARRTY